MDLKTYAVYRKLTANSTLLEHLAKNEPVPIDVLEDDIQELIASLHNTQAEQLVTDYPRYLQEHVQLGTIKDGENQFTINGEIAEPVIQSIEIIHTIDRKDVVSNFITQTMMDLNGHREVEIKNLSLSEAADSFVKLTEMHLLSDDQETSNIDGVVIPEHSHVESFDSVETPDSVESFDSVETPDSFEIPDSFETPDVTKTVPEPEIDMSFMDDVLDYTPDTPDTTDTTDTTDTPALDMSFMDDELPPSNVELEPPMFESPDDDVLDDYVDTDDLEDKPSDSASFKKAYDYLVSELKSRGLDKRLPNLHLA